MAEPRELSIGSDFLADVLAGKRILLADGAMGTLIQQAGLSTVHEVPDLLNLTHPDEICALQRRYVEAGSDCITTNTFNSNRLKLAATDTTVEEVFVEAARIARMAGAQLVAGDIGPTGRLLEPLGDLSFDEAYDIFAEQAHTATAAGCDIIFLETFSDLLEAKAALLACLDQTRLPVFATMTFGADGRTFMGTTPSIAASTLSALGASAVGINCSLGPGQILPLVNQMTAYARCPIMVQPNAGLPCVEDDGETFFDIGPDEFCQAMGSILQTGASVIGGCCGTTPEHISALRRMLDEHGPVPEDVARRRRDSLVVTSAQSMIELGAGSSAIAVVGERINPTGKPLLAQTLLDGSYDLVVSEGAAQAEAGATILDVNVGVPGIDEPAALRGATIALQSTLSTPLQLDSSNPEALEAACRAYAGRPLINSVNGKRESLAAVLPIAARYGAGIVVLTLDENGIPDTADERVDIARRVIAAATKAGVSRTDIVVDCLVMAAATNQEEIPHVLDTVRRCREELGVHTMLGVSNISFGLPERSVLNASFLTAALACGLDMPIINPLDTRYQEALAAFRVLNGADAGCNGYVDFVRKSSSVTARATCCPSTPAHPDDLRGGDSVDIPHGRPEPGDALYEATLSGRRDDAARAASLMIETHDPATIAGDILGPALDEVGRRYDGGDYFLPQLMASAEAAKAAFDVLAAHIGAGERDARVRSESPIVIATVEGDIHDIGKNIVRMLLENHGFAVIDLGRDVPPQRVVDATLESGATLVGLSALMTTTVGAMERTIALLREQAPGVKVMVGGAVLTEDYARRIGADRYAADAAASVRIARELLD